jgi:hypothetical protein
MYSQNAKPTRIGFQVALSTYASTLPTILALVGPGYRIWEFFYGYSDPSYLTPGYFSDAATLGMQRGDLILIKSNEPDAAVVVTNVTIFGAAEVSTDVEGFFASTKQTPISQSPSFGTLVADWSINTVYASGGNQADNQPCPDAASNLILTAQLNGVAADPVNTVTVSGLNIVCNTVKTVVMWMKGTPREGDPIATAYPYQIYFGVGGFGKSGSFVGLIPADGKWHPLIANVDQISATLGGFSWNSADVITTIRIKPTNVADNPTVGYNTASTGEINVCGPVRINPVGRPKFLLRFDDSLGDLVHPVANVNFTLPDGTPAPALGWSGLTLLQHYGFRASCFHLPRRIGTSNALASFLTWEDLKILANNGWANCFQSYYDPLNTANDGIRLLGPDGYAARSVASVDASANTITASGSTLIPIQGSVYGGYPVIFSGTNLPSPLVINKIYWAGATTATAFKLYTNENDSIAGTNPIDLTTTGTPANFTFRYGFSANDYSKYADDWYLGMKMLADNGYGDDSLYVALNQGATDGNVMTLADTVGAKAVFGIYKGATPSVFYPNYSFTENGGTNPALNWKAKMKIVSAVQTDSVGLLTEAQIRGYVDQVVQYGCLGMNYHHKINNPNGRQLSYLLDQLKKYDDAGMIDVITAPEMPLN